MNRRNFLKALGIAAPTTFLAGGLYRFSDWKHEPLPCDILEGTIGELEVCDFKGYQVRLVDVPNEGIPLLVCSRDGLLYDFLEGSITKAEADGYEFGAVQWVTIQVNPPFFNAVAYDS